MPNQSFFNQALSNMYGQGQQRGYGQQNRGYGGGHWSQSYKPTFGGGQSTQIPTALSQTLPYTQSQSYDTYNQPQTSLYNSALADITQQFQNMPTSWDWQGGENAPYGVKTPFLGYQWHYDELGRMVPNDPNIPSAPWNMPGSTITYEDWLTQQQPSSLFRG